MTTGPALPSHPMRQEAEGSAAAPVVPAPRAAGVPATSTAWRWPGARLRERWWLAGAALATAALWFSHLPALLLSAQFYADDGSWYQLAYSLGPVASLPHPANGYLELLQRLTASVSLALPLLWVPLYFNLVALLVEVVGVAYLLSSRMAGAIPSLALRIGIAVLVIALPNAYDTSGNLTNAQWHLGLIAFLVIFARPTKRLAGRLLDWGLLLLSGLTGPYCLLLEPVALWWWLRRREDRRRRNLLLGTTACAALQLLVIWARVGVQRQLGLLAAGFLPLARMLGRQLSLGLITGAHGLNHLAGSPLADSAVALIPLAALPLLACGWAAWRGPAILRALCVYAAIELVLALLAPVIPAPQWPSLGNPASIVDFHPGGIRYFLFPLLAFAISLGWIAWRYLPWPRGPGRPSLDRGSAGVARVTVRWAAGGIAAAALVATAVIGVPADWAYPPYVDYHWSAEVQRFETAPSGTTVMIPINPPGYTFSLVSR